VQCSATSARTAPARRPSNHFWVFMLISAGLAMLLVWGAGVAFRRAQR